MCIKYSDICFTPVKTYFSFVFFKTIFITALTCLHYRVCIIIIVLLIKDPIIHLCIECLTLNIDRQKALNSWKVMPKF